MRSIYTLPAISVKLSPDRLRPNGGGMGQGYQS